MRKLHFFQIFELFYDQTSLGSTGLGKETVLTEVEVNFNHLEMLLV